MVRRMPAELSAVSSHAIALEAPPQEGGVDAALGWFSLYLPSWGSSFVLHVGAVILALFFAVAQQPAAELTPPLIGWTPIPRPPQIEKARKVATVPFESVGKLKPQPSHFSFIPNDLNTPGIGDLVTVEYVGIIGIGGDRRGGGLEGLGTRDMGTLFPPLDEQSHKIVYVVDRSGSMTDSIDYVKLEMKRSIATLPDEADFHVIFYSSGPPQEMPTRRLVSATERNKELAFAFIDEIVAVGETDPSKALERAFASKPDLIYLLTDGEFDRQIIDLVKRLNVGGKVTVQTIGFLYTTPGTASEEILKTIASQNGGHYKFVSVEDLSALGQP
jgi:hypothetical protein